MAASTTIIWGAHVPDATASPHVRLRCALLDLLDSPNFANLGHTAGPYFGTSNPLLCLCTSRDFTQNSEQGAFLSTGLDSIPNIKYLVFSVDAYRSVTPGGQRSYTVAASAEVFDANRQAITGITETGETRDIATRIEFEWPCIEGFEDIVPSLGWDCVAGIIQHQSRMQCEGNGMAITDALELRRRMLEDPDPLRHLGYLGWPGMVLTATLPLLGLPTIPVPTFRRA